MAKTVYGVAVARNPFQLADFPDDEDPLELLAVARLNALSGSKKSGGQTKSKEGAAGKKTTKKAGTATGCPEGGKPRTKETRNPPLGVGGSTLGSRRSQQEAKDPGGSKTTATPAAAPAAAPASGPARLPRQSWQGRIFRPSSRNPQQGNRYKTPATAPKTWAPAVPRTRSPVKPVTPQAPPPSTQNTRPTSALHQENPQESSTPARPQMREPLPPSAYLDFQEDEDNLYLQNKSQAASRYSRSFDRKDYRKDDGRFGRGRGSGGRWRGRRTGVRGFEKKDGGGSRNWGKPSDQQPEEGEDKRSEKDSPGLLSLEEWRAAREAARSKPVFNVRKPGEGEDLSRWNNMYALHNKKQTIQEEEEEYAAYCDYPQRCGRQKHLEIEVRFKERRSRGSRGSNSSTQQPPMTQEGGGQDVTSPLSTNNYNRHPSEEPALDSPSSAVDPPQVFDVTQFPALIK